MSGPYHTCDGETPYIERVSRWWNEDRTPPTVRVLVIPRVCPWRAACAVTSAAMAGVILGWCCYVAVIRYRTVDEVAGVEIISG